MMRLYLERPPSLNHLFPSGKDGARHRSPAYEKWRKVCGPIMMIQRPQAIHGPVRIDIVIRDEGSGDLDNFCKGAIDLLVHHKLIDGDNRPVVREIRMSWGDPMWRAESFKAEQPMGCTVEVRAA